MTLRRRFLLTTLLACVPASALLVRLQLEVRRRSQARSLGEFALAVMNAGGRMACEADPSRFPGTSWPGGSSGPAGAVLPILDVGPATEGPDAADAPVIGPPAGVPATRVLDPVALGGLGASDGGPEVALWAYDEDLHAANPAAPIPSRALRDALADGEGSASEPTVLQGAPALRVLIRTPWRRGPCAYLLVDGTLPPRPEEDRVILWGLVGLSGVLLCTAWATGGPVVARIRRLQALVQGSEAAGYASAVSLSGRDELADLARAFDAAGTQVRRHVAEVEAREGTLRRFVADTTHDVMVPLTVLEGHLAAMREAARDGRPAEASLVRSGLEEAHYLGSLLHNLGAVAKLEAAPLDRHDGPVDLGRLVERVAERHRPLATGRGLSLEHAVPAAPLVVQGDVTLLEQAANNVVHNAVRHNVTGRHVAIVLEATPDGFSLRVLDDGPGVPDDDLPHLGRGRSPSPFVRTRPAGRLGLGLSIARRVLERHGFTLELRNRRPTGLEATMRGAVATGPASAP